MRAAHVPAVAARDTQGVMDENDLESERNRSKYVLAECREEWINLCLSCVGGWLSACLRMLASPAGQRKRASIQVSEDITRLPGTALSVKSSCQAGVRATGV